MICQPYTLQLFKQRWPLVSKFEHQCFSGVVLWDEGQLFAVSADFAFFRSYSGSGLTISTPSTRGFV